MRRVKVKRYLGVTEVYILKYTFTAAVVFLLS